MLCNSCVVLTGPVASHLGITFPAGLRQTNRFLLEFLREGTLLLWHWPVPLSWRSLFQVWGLHKTEASSISKTMPPEERVDLSVDRTQPSLFPGWPQNIAFFKATEVEEGKDSFFCSIEVFLAAVNRPMLQ